MPRTNRSPEVMVRVLEPFYSRKKVAFWAKMYSSGPFSCRMSSNQGIRTITVVNVLWDKVEDPILQFMDVEDYFKVSHHSELKQRFKSFMEDIAHAAQTYEGLLSLSERGII